MADLVEETLQGIRARLEELAPAVAEYERLQAAYAALDTGGGAQQRRRGDGGAASGARSSRPRAKRGENKAAMFAVIAERPGVTVSEIAAVTGIAKPLVYNATRAGVERGELERVSLPGGLSGFRRAQGSTQASPPPDG